MWLSVNYKYAKVYKIILRTQQRRRIIILNYTLVIIHSRDLLNAQQSQFLDYFYLLVLTDF